MDKHEASRIMQIALNTDIGYKTWTISTPHLEMAFEIVARMEREACANIADEWSGHYQANAIAQAIRDRSVD